jgi:Carboxypeptidase regulatory-like domain
MKNWTIALLLVAVPVCPRLWAQGEAVTARLSGTVLDPDEAPVPAARIKLANSEAGLIRQVLTSYDGSYILTAIPPGRYQLTIEKEGFATYLRSEVVLTVGQSTTINPKLEVGSVNQVIEVAADAPLLNSGNSNIGSEVSGKQAVELPLNIRNVYNLVGLSSSVNNNTEYQGLT